MSADDEICRRQKHKCHKHTQRNRKRNKKCIGNTHKKHQNHQHQYKTNYDGIYQVIK